MKCKYIKIRSKNYKKYYYCFLHKKIININICNYCNNKIFKIYKKMKKRTSKQIKKDKERFSIITDNLIMCIECGQSPVELHECIGGRNRTNSIKWGLVIPLCHNCHKTSKIVQKWRIKAQDIWINYHHSSKENFIEIFKRFKN